MAADHTQEFNQSQSIAAFLALSQTFSMLHTEILATKQHFTHLNLILSQSQLPLTNFLDTWVVLNSHVSVPSDHKKEHAMTASASSIDEVNTSSTAHTPFLSTPAALSEEIKKAEADMTSVQSKGGDTTQAQAQLLQLRNSLSHVLQQASPSTAQVPAQSFMQTADALRVLNSTSHILNTQLLALYTTLRSLPLMPAPLTPQASSASSQNYAAPLQPSSLSSTPLYAEETQQALLTLTETIVTLPARIQELLGSVDVHESAAFIQSLSIVFEQIAMAIQALPNDTHSLSERLTQLSTTLEEELSQQPFIHVSEAVTHVIEEIMSLLANMQGAVAASDSIEAQTQDVSSVLYEWTKYIGSFFESIREVSDAHLTAPLQDTAEEILAPPTATSTATRPLSAQSHVTMNFDNILSIGQVSKDGLSETELKEYIVTTVAEILDEHLREHQLSS